MGLFDPFSLCRMNHSRRHAWACESFYGTFTLFLQLIGSHAQLSNGKDAIKNSFRIASRTHSIIQFTQVIWTWLLSSWSMKQ